MALFQKKPEVGHGITFTTYGMNKSLVIVGLGNIGDEYDGTRHNIGFDCVDDFARRNDFPAWINKTDFNCQITQTSLGDQRVILVKPTTFMNLSGKAVQAVTHFYKIQTEQVVVVHDELDIDFGQIRLRRGGGDAGHNGIKSVTEAIGDQFGRIRVGIGPKTHPEMDSSAFVLQKFSGDQEADKARLIREVDAILSELAFGAPFPTETRSFL